MRVILNLLIVVVLAQSSRAQDIKFDKLVIEEGLTSVNAILIDELGYRWFGGTHGLYRFDGNDFDIFTHNPSDTNSLSYNDVLVLSEDHHSNIWIGTSNHGVNLFDRKMEMIVRFSDIPILSSSSVSAIGIDNQDNTWIGTIGNGIFVLNRNRKLVGRYAYNVLDESSLSNNDVFDFLLDSKGDLWVVTNSGKLDRFISSDSTFAHYPFMQQPIFGVRSGQKLLEVDSNSIWVGTEGHGVFELDIGTGTFSRYNKENQSLSNNVITGLSLDSNGDVWISTDGGGLNHFKLAGQVFASYVHDPANEFSLSNNASYSLFVDDEDRVWLGMGDGRVNISNTGSIGFIRAGSGLGFDVVVDIVIDGEDRLWVATGGAGTDILDLTSGKTIKHINTSTSDVLATDIILCLAEGDHGTMWMGSFQGGAYQLDKEGEVIKKLASGGRSNRLSNNHIFDIARDRQGHIWFATQGGGVDKSDPEKEMFSNFNTNNNSGLASDRIQSLLVDQKDRVWVGHFHGGLQVYDRSKRTFVSVDLPGDLEERLQRHPIHAMHQDADGRISLGTGGLGFISFDLNVRNCVSFDSSNGLPSDAVYGIIKYEDVYWLSTNNGIVQLDLESTKIKVIDKSDGLLSSDFESGAIDLSGDGKLFFGSKKGIVYFDPDELSDPISEPRPILTKLTVNNELVAPGAKIRGREILEESLLTAQKLELPNDFNSFSLLFSCPSCRRPKKVQYRYRLKGLEDQWIKAPFGRRFVSYSNIGHDRYELLVQASDDQGLTWSPSRSLTVIIHPPFYLTKVAFAGYLLLAIATVILVYLFIRSRIALRNELKFEKFARDKDNELNKEKINFFTSISHEIRTPLTLILGHLERLFEFDDLSGKLRNELAIVRRNGNRLLILVNQLLDFRKMESGQMRLKVAELDLVSIVSEILSPFRELAMQKEITLNFDYPSELANVWIDASKIDIILYNLLSNALKFTPAKGVIRLSVARNQSGVKMQVADSGTGIAREDLERVFQPFFQGNAGAKYGVTGTGIGLALVKDVVELHHGTIEVQSIEGEGTVFTVGLPAQRSQYAQDEVMSFVMDEPKVQPETPPQLDDPLEVNPALQLLLVEDNEDILRYLVDTFCDQYSVITAKDGREGLLLAYEHIPDVIISDVMMPMMDGMEMCRHLKEDLRTNHIPIILLTARTGFIHEHSGLDTGADDYITKPFKPQLLKMRVFNLIQNRQLIHKKFRQELILEPKHIDVLNPNEQFLSELMQQVENHITNSDYSVKDLARNMGLSHSVLYRKIHALTNLSISDFIKSIRLKRARQLFVDGTTNISEVSYRVGFSNPKYFSTCFKAAYDKTPSEFVAAMAEMSLGDRTESADTGFRP